MTGGVHSATVVCDDGFELSLRAFEAANPVDRSVLIAAAAGVPARFYYNFATWLAHRGMTTVTWDWRGIGENAPSSLKDFDARMLDWATLDLPAVVDWTCERYGRPIVGIGHSFGGQAFGLADRPDAFARLVLFASGHAHWRLWPRPDRYALRVILGALLLATRLFGYLPGRAMGLGADLPGGVARQWIGWCLNPDYLGRWDGHAAIEAPVLSYAFSDDRYAPLASRRALLEKYGGAKELVTAEPREFGLRRVGHLDFFRQRFADTLWPAFLPRLLADTESTASPR